MLGELDVHIQHCGMLPRKPDQVLFHVDPWRNLWGLTSGDQIEMEKGDGLIATRAQILAQFIPACSSSSQE